MHTPHTHVHVHACNYNIIIYTRSLSLTHSLTHSHTSTLVTHAHTHSYLNETGPAPHIPLLCREDTLNFFDEFPGWLELLDEANETLPGFFKEEFLDFIIDMLMEISERYPNCQKTLFDFPLYYVGR